MRYHNPTPFWRDDVNGTAGNDEIFTYWDNDIIHGFEGDDILNGGQGNDTIFGGDDNDRIFGDNSNDTLFGEDGNDTIDGGMFIDQISGGDDDDRIIGGSDADRMFGDEGNDTFVQRISDRNDLMDGGQGSDRIDYGATSYKQVTLTLADGNEFSNSVVRVREFLSHGIFGELEDIGLSDPWTERVRSIENVTTGVEDDQITGNSDVNRISTNGGDDILTGRGGEDFLNGGGGSDTFIFEATSDSAMGRTGLFDPGPNFATTDLIYGFGDSRGNQDVLDLSRIDAMQSTTSVGNQSFRMDDGDGRIEIGELQFRTIVDNEQSGRNVTAIAADTNGDGRFDFGIRFDREVTSLDSGDFIL